MSEVKLNLIDAQVIVAGAIHGSIADRFIAALSAEPENILELCAALSRYEKPREGFKLFASFRPVDEVDPEPWDAGLVVIDLAARIIAADSTYTQPGPEGVVHYHDGTQATDVPIHYRLPADWLFVNSLEAYRWSRDRRREERKKKPPLDARAVLYGRPLLEFIVKSIGTFPIPLGEGQGEGLSEGTAGRSFPLPLGEGQGEGLSDDTAGRSFPLPLGEGQGEGLSDDTAGRSFPLPLGEGQGEGLSGDITHKPSFPLPLGEGQGEGLSDDTTPSPIALGDRLGESPEEDPHATQIRSIHANWLLTPRPDLRNQSPRDVMLEKHDLISFDLETRSLQWSMLGEGPPCLAQDSFAYRFGGFGSHEWIVYYDLVRHLLWRAFELDLKNPDEAVNQLELLKHDWLESTDEYEGKVPANIINNERRRLPEAMTPQELIIDENCECCRMMAQDAEMGFGPGFWHLDGCNMDEGFAFSSCLTLAEWEAEQRRREEFDREFQRNWQEREQRRARGEPVEPFPWEPQANEDPF